MRFFNQQRYDADLIRALQIENEALHKRNAELERALARIEAITAPSRLAQPCATSKGGSLGARASRAHNSRDPELFWAPKEVRKWTKTKWW